MPGKAAKASISHLFLILVVADVAVLGRARDGLERVQRFHKLPPAKLQRLSKVFVLERTTHR